MTIQTKIHSAESGHWYSIDGAPAYTQVAKNGKVRNTTLADARKQSLVPSVTTIINVLAKPALETWKLNQLLKASVLYPQGEGESTEEYAKRLIEISQADGREAADVGTTIHAAIERYFLGEEVVHYRADAVAVHDELVRLTGLRDGWIAEASFASPLGFGGRIDLYHPAGVVADVKTKDFSESTIDTVRAYDDHGMQLAAYREGMEMPQAKLINLFVSRPVRGLVKSHVWDEKDVTRYWELFKAVLRVWQLQKNFYPDFRGEFARVGEAIDRAVLTRIL